MSEPIYAICRILETELTSHRSNWDSITNGRRDLFKDMIVGDNHVIKRRSGWAYFEDRTTDQTLLRVKAVLVDDFVILGAFHEDGQRQLGQTDNGDGTYSGVITYPLAEAELISVAPQIYDTDAYRNVLTVEEAVSTIWLTAGQSPRFINASV